MNSAPIDTEIPVLGEAKIPSPVQNHTKGANNISFVSDNERVAIDVRTSNLFQKIKQNQEPSSFEQAGPRNSIFFDPSKLRCALVTCGGLCPERHHPVHSFGASLGLWCSHDLWHPLWPAGIYPKIRSSGHRPDPGLRRQHSRKRRLSSGIFQRPAGC